MAEPPEDRRMYVGTTTEVLVRNARDVPAIIRRYWAFSLIAGLVAGGIAWWAVGDLVAGAVAGICVFVSGFIVGWGLEPFLPADRRVIRPIR